MSELTRIEKVVFLQTVDVFARCRAEEVLRIASIAHERSFEEGERLFGAGEPADELYSVVRGAVRLDTGESEGADSIHAGPLQTVGILDILSGRLRGRSATATEPTLTLAFAADDLFDLLANNIDIVKALFRHLSEGGASAGGGLA